jgi:hypothetical protein
MGKAAWICTVGDVNVENDSILARKIITRVILNKAKFACLKRKKSVQAAGVMNKK